MLTLISTDLLKCGHSDESNGVTYDEYVTLEENLAMCWEILGSVFKKEIRRFVEKKRRKET